MKIAVLSGKGGTGKTFVSVNLAVVALKSVYVDCDVEEPNGHLFLKPNNIRRTDVLVKNPAVNTQLCTACRRCVEFCKFSALAYIGNQLLVFNELCHSCSGCVVLCPEKALTEVDRKIGIVEQGMSEDIRVLTGFMNPGEASGTPMIEALLEDIDGFNSTVIIDCPPGSACLVMDSIKSADYCILVAEPTRFGVHNLNMVYELVKLFDKPFGVVVNKSMSTQDPVTDFCIENQVDVLERIPYCTELGELNSNGLIAVNENKKYHGLFTNLLHRIGKELGHEAITNP